MITYIHGFLGTKEDAAVLGNLDSQPDKRVLIGYSLGGRLALRDLINGDPYDCAVIISAGLNLEDEKEREERRARDEMWARRFESDPWDELMRDWNAQPVFGGHVVERFEKDYDRRLLSWLLREYSPGRLPPLAPRLHEIQIPILWIVGERDKTYVEIGRRAVSLLPNAELWICPNAGHRVPWERPQAFAARLRDFLQLSS